MRKPRFSAWFDCGETDERMPEWLVVEYTFDDGEGNRVGEIVADMMNQQQAEQLAAELNAGYERELFANQECEFDISP